ncbi:Ig-like domain-containing protein [Candidatus Pantoea persica]|uniref:Ig-like domain-containing protein n=1 Tax=Candidatus Pantoea persica TaxID=2518128 RepID=UPI00215D8535|nr:Ig-like domain-containing protein [Candidatus Pantoea persica]
MLGSVTADASGQWNFTPAGLTDGTYAFCANTTNVDGSVTPSQVLTITVDTAVPTTPVNLQLVNDDGATVSTDGATNDNTLTLSLIAPSPLATATRCWAASRWARTATGSLRCRCWPSAATA